MKMFAVLVVLVLCVGDACGKDFQIEGELGFELRNFLHHSAYVSARNNYASISSLIEFGIYDDNDKHALIIKAFVRGDSGDSRRSHGDLREAKYRYVNGDFELTLGIDKVFWGVAEFAHLVDIINQTDFVESVDGEQKLGQTMVRASYVSPVGTFTGFFMPEFKPRNFSGSDGRPNGNFLVDTSREFYQSSDGRNHDDFAFRYNSSFDVWDLGLSYFNGTSREPLLIKKNLIANLVVPYYPQREQFSIDLQATLDSWLLKLEALKQIERTESVGRLVAGFEYTYYGIFDSFSDLGVVVEYMWDERKLEAPNLFNDDLGFGLRWTANDVNSTTLLAGAIYDLETSSVALSFEAERRLSNQLKFSLEARFQVNVDQQDLILYPLRNEDFLRLQATYYF